MWRKTKISLVSFVMVSVLFGSFLSFPSVSSWSSATVISSDDGKTAAFPQGSMVCNNDKCDIINVVWVEEHTYSAPEVCDVIMHTRSTNHGSSWSTPGKISKKHSIGSDCGNAGAPSMSVDSVSGNVYVIWPNAYKAVSGGGPGQMFYHIYLQHSTNDGQDWQQSDQIIDDTITFGDPQQTESRIVANEYPQDTIGVSVYANNEYIHAVFETEFGLDPTYAERAIRYDRASFEQPTGWGTDQLISKSTSTADGEDPAIEAYGSGNYVHVGFIDDDPYRGLYYQRNTNDGASGSWYANPVALTLNHIANPTNPDISVNEKYVHFVWEDSRFYGTPDFGSSEIYYLRSSDNGGTWDTPNERLSDGSVGFWTSIVVDSSGNTYVSYRDGTDSDLKYAYCASPCSTPTTVTVDSDGDTGMWNSLVRDGGGNLHISYYDATDGDLWYAVCTTTCTSAGNWNKAIADDTTDDVGQYSSITVDSNNKPYISYYDATNTNLSYAKCTAASCTTQANWNDYVVDSSADDVGLYTSIKLESNNNYPRITYYDVTDGELMYAEYTGSVWNTVEVDSSDNDVGLFTSLELDSNNDPRVAYYDATGGDLKYAYCDSNCHLQGSWTTEFAFQDSTASNGQYASIAIDSVGNPHASYYDETNGNLKYTWSTGCVWCVEVVDFEGDVGKFSSLALDSNDNPQISYFDDTNDDLKYAVKSGSDWDLVKVDETGSVGLWTSIAVDSNDDPHISYHDATDEKLYYARCTSTCTSAGSWTKMDLDGRSNSPAGEYTSIALDSNDRARISYYDGDSAHLKFAICTEDSCIQGNDWDTTTVDFSTNVGTYTSIDIDSSGNNHISYYDANNNNLKYATCSSDCDRANSWSYGGIMTGNEDDGKWSSIETHSASDLPRVAFTRDGSDDDLMYAECTTTSCTNSNNWNSLAVETSGNKGQYSSLALDSSNNPHIFHYDADTAVHRLRYTKCTGEGCTTSASNWDGEQVDYDGIDVVGLYASLALDSNNKPHISFTNFNRVEVWYAEKTGESWVVEPVDTPCNVGLYTAIDLDNSNDPFISYYDSTDTDISFADKSGTNWQFTTVDSSAGSKATLERYHKEPTIASQGATSYVAWVLDDLRGAPQCRACEIRFDTNRDNGDQGEWGTDDGIYPTAWPPYHVDRDASVPDITVYGNDLHVFFTDIGTHANKVPEVYYTKEIDTISDGGDLDEALKGTVAVKAQYEGGALPVNRVFVIGGEYYVDSTLTITDDVWMYDPGSDSGTKYCDLGLGLSYASAVWVDADDKIYVFGGKTTTGGNPTSQISYIDLTTPDCGDTTDDLLNGVGLYGTSAVFDGTKAYIFGGKSTTEVNTIQSYRPSDGQVSDEADLNSARFYTSAVFDSSTGYAYIFGGIGGDPATRKDEILKFDTSSPGNTVLLTTDLPTARDGTSAAFDGTYAYVFGGEDGTGLLDEIVRFNPVGNWDVGGIVTCKALPDAVRDSSAAIVGTATITSGNGLRVFGGDNGSGDNTDTISVLMISYWGRF